MVGAKGFEPSTLWSQTRCATRLRYAPTGLYSTASRPLHLRERPRLSVICLTFCAQIYALYCPNASQPICAAHFGARPAVPTSRTGVGA